ncbi:DUF368 domain-containing protein [Xylanivirga thermophila]|uniref:DUF368 domain-containing protein n=1 Tax=Xylanivirga thermophila TaxID=2496273 RepID=UPI0013E9E114|nr:DUF368 domain-containing protein [Xylanivirga thermophila]
MKNIFIGMIMGISNIIPGISGGTMAVLLGIYDVLIKSIGNFSIDWRNNLWFLLQIGIGALAGFFIFSKLVSFLISEYEVYANYFFIGLILGSCPMIYKKAVVDKWNIKYFLVFLCFLVLQIIIFVLNISESEHFIIRFITWKYYIYIFSGGIISAIAMIIPGISGSLSLVVIGLYSTVITALAEWNITLLLPFAIGSVIGLFVGSKLISRWLQEHPQVTYLSILGLVLGSIIYIFPGFSVGGQFFISILCAIIGFFIAYFLG